MCMQCVTLQCVCIYSTGSQCCHCVFFKIYFLSGRLQKSRLAKEEFEGKLKDLQDSLLTTKKQIPASDDKHSSEKVIHMLVMRQSTDYTGVWVKCRGSSPLFYVCLFFNLLEKGCGCGIFLDSI